MTRSSLFSRIGKRLGVGSTRKGCLAHRGRRLVLEPLEHRQLLSATVYVNGAWAGVANGADPDGAGPATAIGTDAFVTIQAGINKAANGDTISVAAGTYHENLTVNKRITLDGAGSGSDPAGNTIIQSAVGNTPVMILTTGGISAADRMVIKDVRITGAASATGSNAGAGASINGGSGFITFDNVSATGNAGSGICANMSGSLTDILVTNSNLSSNGGAGFRVPSSLSTLNGLTVQHSVIRDNTNLGLNINPGESDNAISNVVVNDIEFGGNGSNADLFVYHPTGPVSITDARFTGSAIGSFGLEMGGLANALATIVLNDLSFTNAYKGGGMCLYEYDAGAISPIAMSGVKFDLTGGKYAQLLVDSVQGNLNVGDSEFAGTPGLPDIVLYSESAPYPATTVIVDATAATFTGAANGFDIEDRVYHALDDSTVGLVTWTPNNVYVTPDSGSIQRGINAATVGGTVNVEAGVYQEQLTISKALTVTGQDGAVLDGTGLAATWTTGVKIKSGNVTFNNIDVSNFTQDGIIIGYEASTPGSLQNVHVTNCTISNIQPGNHGFGIYAGYEAEAFKYSPPKLTAHLDYSGLLIEGNEIVNAASSSVVLQSITGTPGTIVVRNNYIHDGENDGIWIDSARNIVVEDNVVANNMDGIYISSYGDAFLYKWVYDWNNQQLNGPYGPMNILITENQITGNTTYGGIYLQAGYPATISINGNDLSGNGIGVGNYLAEPVDAVGNWWGTIVPAEIAGAVVGPVHYTPWLTEGTDTEPDVMGFQPIPLDTQAPAAPGVALTSDTGTSDTDGITKEGGLTITAEPDALVEYLIDGEATWTTAFSAVEGVNTLQVRQTDLAGNVSPATTFSFTLDTVAPVLTASISAPSANGWYDITSGPAVVTYAVVDTNPPAVPSPYTFGDGVDQSIAAITVTDLAGNVSNPAGALSGINQDTGNMVPGIENRNGVLYVIGTAKKDDINVEYQAADHRYKVHTNFTKPADTYVPEDAITEVVVLGLAGDDNIKIGGSVKINALIDGGMGNDDLEGGKGNDILIGGGGNDQLKGSDGLDILIGGVGADTLQGKHGNEVLIAGYTAYDGNYTALRQIRTRWTAPTGQTDPVLDYAARVDAVMGGTYALNAASVFDDGTVDHLVGNGDLDLFFANLSPPSAARDKISGLKANEKPVVELAPLI